MDTTQLKYILYLYVNNDMSPLEMINSEHRWLIIREKR